MPEWNNLKNFLFDCSDNKPLKTLSEIENSSSTIPQSWFNVIDQEDVKAWTSPYDETDFPEYRGN